jgi:hypothetical protein
MFVLFISSPKLTLEKNYSKNIDPKTKLFITLILFFVSFNLVLDDNEKNKDFIIANINKLKDFKKMYLLLEKILHSYKDDEFNKFEKNDIKINNNNNNNNNNNLNEINVSIVSSKTLTFFIKESITIIK